MLLKRRRGRRDKREQDCHSHWRAGDADCERAHGVGWCCGRSGTEAVAIGSITGSPGGLSLSFCFMISCWPFEVTSVLILIAIMGAVVLASRPDSQSGEGGSNGAIVLLPAAQRISVCVWAWSDF